MAEKFGWDTAEIQLRKIVFEPSLQQQGLFSKPDELTLNYGPGV